MKRCSKNAISPPTLQARSHLEATASPPSIFADIVVPSDMDYTEAAPRILTREKVVADVFRINAELACLLESSSFLDHTQLYDHVAESLCGAAHDFVVAARHSAFPYKDAWKILLNGCQSLPALLRHKYDVAQFSDSICKLSYAKSFPESGHEDLERDAALLRAAAWLHDVGKADTSELLVKGNRLHKTRTLNDALKDLPKTFAALERAKGKHAPNLALTKEILTTIAEEPEFLSRLAEVLSRNDPKEKALWRPYIDTLKMVWSILVFDANCPINKQQEYSGVIDQHDVLGYKILDSSGVHSEIADIMMGHHEYYCNGQTKLDDENKAKKKFLNNCLTIADATNAILCRRNNSHPPRQSRGNIENVLTEYLKNSGTQFDPEIISLLLSNEHSTMQTWKKLELGFYPGSVKTYDLHADGVPGFVERLLEDLRQNTMFLDGVTSEQIADAGIDIATMFVREFSQQEKFGEHAQGFNLVCELSKDGRLTTFATTNTPDPVHVQLGLARRDTIGTIISQEELKLLYLMHQKLERLLGADRMRKNGDGKNLSDGSARLDCARSRYQLDEVMQAPQKSH